MIEAEKAAGNDRKRGVRLAADYFYRGPIAREIDAWMKKNNGLIRYTDLATHVTRIEEPLSHGLPRIHRPEVRLLDSRAVFPANGSDS